MPKIKYHIQHQKHRDLHSLANIYSDSIRYLGPQFYSESQVAAWSSFPDDLESFKNWVTTSTTFVAVNDEGNCLGFGGLESARRISALFVAPEFHRMGVANSLLKHLLEAAKALNTSIVTTEASEFSKPLFEKFGFAVREVEHTEFKGVAFTRSAMQLPF